MGGENVQSNTQKPVEWNRVNVQQLRLEPLTADPGDVEDGDIWYRGDTNAFRGRVNGVTKTFTLV